jgi:folate-binding Fe-S cluster repair protein YgfZ
MLCQGFALKTNQGFLIDVRAEMAPKLAGHLNRYKLRAKVRRVLLCGCYMHAAWLVAV